MSLESAKKFIERLKADENFRKKASEFKDAEARTNFVKSQGFDFTKEDIELVKSELSNEELESIVGGTSGDACWTPISYDRICFI